MKIIVTASGQTADSAVDPRFGRAAHFILVDTETGQATAMDNSAGVNATQGAGIQAAQAVSRLGAECVITGHCGPKAFQVLASAGIVIYTGAEGTVADAVEQMKGGKLQLATSPDVRGHWM